MDRKPTGHGRTAFIGWTNNLKGNGWESYTEWGSILKRTGKQSIGGGRTTYRGLMEVLKGMDQKTFTSRVKKFLGLSNRFDEFTV